MIDEIERAKAEMAFLERAQPALDQLLRIRRMARVIVYCYFKGDAGDKSKIPNLMKFLEYEFREDDDE